MAATALKHHPAKLDKAFCEAVAGLPQVTRVVVVHLGAEPSYVVTVGGDWVQQAPAVHRAVRPLRRREEVPFHYRTIREEWQEPDPTPSRVLYART